MKKFVAALAALAMLAWVPLVSAGGWGSSVNFSNQVVSSPAKGGGYPIPAGQTAPVPGTCPAGSWS